jgi:hypothetical protein
MRGIMKNIMAVSVALGLVAGGAKAALLGNSCITNFATATFSLPSGAAGTGGIKAGRDRFNVPNSFTAAICASDTPSLCMKAWKTTEPPTASIAESGGLACFTISFLNCGNYSGFSVTVTDVMPGNTMRADDGAGPGSKMWVAEGAGQLGCIGWATAMSGPWYCTDSPVGQVGPLYLRWIFQRIGMGNSGYVRYCVTIL